MVAALAISNDLGEQMTAGMGPAFGVNPKYAYEAGVASCEGSCLTLFTERQTGNGKALAL